MGVTEFGSVSDTAVAPASPRLVDCCGNAHWRSKLLTTEKGSPAASIANVLLALKESPAWAGVLRYDEFRGVSTFILPPPWHRGTFHPRAVTERDATWATNWMHIEGIAAASSTVAEAIEAVAGDCSFHPVRDYLQ